MSYEAWGEPDARPWPRDLLPACMGGNCTLRGKCARYHQEARRWRPEERLCTRGGHDLWRPIVVEPRIGVPRVLSLLHRRSQEPMTPDQFNAMRAQAENIVRRSRAGQAVDEFSLEWAETLLAQNPIPVTAAPAEKEQTWL